MRHEFQFFFPWWMVMTIIYYSRSFWVQKTFSLPLTKPPIYCMGGKYFFSSVCLVIMSLLFYKWNRCRYVTVHYDTMLFGYKLWGYRNVYPCISRNEEHISSQNDRVKAMHCSLLLQIYSSTKVYLMKHHFSVIIFEVRTTCKNNVLLSLKQTFSFNVISSINRMKGR